MIRPVIISFAGRAWFTHCSLANVSERPTRFRPRKVPEAHDAE